jgi:hypothetical protein
MRPMPRPTGSWNGAEQCSTGSIRSS